MLIYQDVFEKHLKNLGLDYLLPMAGLERHMTMENVTYVTI